ncbi:MAG: MerR family transcriptional regulator [Bifidobacteriaceae bacterium]|nr:MerR family transcriptional regulator [Bifidobacteriaceae bacterium]
MSRSIQQTRALYELCAIALIEGRADLDGADEVGFDIDLPIFTVGHTAELVNIHPQTLRQYDRERIVIPQRTEGGARRYSLRDINTLVQAQTLSQHYGVNLAGIIRILDLQEENRQLRRQVKRLSNNNQNNMFATGTDGDIVEVQRASRRRANRKFRELNTSGLTSQVSKSVVVWRDF